MSKSKKGFSDARATQKRGWMTTQKFIVKAKRATLNIMSDPTGLHCLGTVNMKKCYERFRSHFEAAAKLDNAQLCDADPQIARDAEPKDLRCSEPSTVVQNILESYTIKKLPMDIPLMADCELKPIVLQMFKMELTKKSGTVCSKINWGNSESEPESFPKSISFEDYSNPAHPQKKKLLKNSTEILKESLWIFLQSRGIDPRNHVEKNEKYFQEIKGKLKYRDFKSVEEAYEDFLAGLTDPRVKGKEIVGAGATGATREGAFKSVSLP